MKSLLKGYILLFFVFSLSLAAKPLKNIGHDVVNASNNCLFVGFGKKYDSNYYLKSMISNEIGMEVNQLDSLLSNLFLSTFLADENTQQNYVCPNNDPEFEKMIEKIRYLGEKEKIYPDLSQVNTEVYQSILQHYNLNYMIVFSQYYMKRQENPFPTLFHIVNYTLYNQSKEEIFKGQEFSNSYDLIDYQGLKEIFRKIRKKQLATIEKIIPQAETSSK